MSGRASTHRNSTLAARAAVAVAVGLAGCEGASSDSKSVAAASSPAVKKAVTPTPSPTPTPVLDLVDDDESADAGKSIVVDVLSNDTFYRVRERATACACSRSGRSCRRRS
ncbi:hypothetical protein [Streptomyces sp. NPDC054887]